MTTLTAPLQSINIGAAANDGTGDVPRTVGQKLNVNQSALLNRAKIPGVQIVYDGDSHAAFGEPAMAMSHVAFRNNLDVLLASRGTVTNFGVGGTNSGSTGSNLTASSRMATTATAISALTGVSGGIITGTGNAVDAVLIMGVNDIAAAFTNDTIMANIRKYHEQLIRPCGVRYLWLIGVTPKAGSSVTANAQALALNKEYRAYAASRPDVIFIDPTDAWLDPSASNIYGLPIPYASNNGTAGSESALPAGSVTKDGLHASNYGNCLMSYPFEARMLDVYPVRSARDLSRANVFSTTSPGGNAVGNNSATGSNIGRMVAMGGTNQGMTVNSGSPPLGWFLNSAANNGITLDFSTANITVSAYGPSLPIGTIPVVNLALGGTLTADTILKIYTYCSPTGGYAVGDVIRTGMLVRLNAVTGLLGMQSQYAPNPNPGDARQQATLGLSASDATSPLASALPTLNGVYYMESDGYPIASITTGGFFNTFFYFANGATAGGSIDLISAWVEKVVPVPASA